MALVTTVKNKETDNSPFFSVTEENCIDFIICKSPDRVKQLVAAVVPGKQIHFVSDGDWSNHDLIITLIQKFHPAELFITTYAIRDFPIKQLILAQERGEIVSIKLLIDSRAQIRSPEAYSLAAMNVNQIAQTSIHAKVTVMRSPVGCVTVVSSQNWTQNPKIEAGVITCSESIAFFHLSWIEKIMSNAEIFK